MKEKKIEERKEKNQKPEIILLLAVLGMLKTTDLTE